MMTVLTDYEHLRTLLAHGVRLSLIARVCCELRNFCPCTPLHAACWARVSGRQVVMRCSLTPNHQVERVSSLGARLGMPPACTGEAWPAMQEFPQWRCDRIWAYQGSRNCVFLRRSSGLVSQPMSRSIAWLTLGGKARHDLNWLQISGYPFTHLLQPVS